jgi:hypothetical protein
MFIAVGHSLCRNCAMKKTVLDQVVSIHSGSNAAPWQDAPGLKDDPRWQLAQRVVDSPQFNKSPRLAKFLLYIVAKSLAGRQSEVTEQQIGVHVFGRPRGYRTVDDNIVRNYARQLRKRLAEHFASGGINDPMRIEIPLGGYLPTFIGQQLGTPAKGHQAQSKPILVERRVLSTPDSSSQPAIVSRRDWTRILAGTSLLIAYSAALICLTCFVVWHVRAPHQATEFIRFSRDLRFDDLKSANAVIIGSSCSDPWAIIAERTTNFHIHCDSGMQGASIVNLKPQPGELASYASHWNEPVHETYALITFIPNMSGNGHLLFLEGLDVAGTQAAAEALLRAETISPILERAKRPDGSLAAFEVLLRSTSIDTNSTETHVIASRIY